MQFIAAITSLFFFFTLALADTVRYDQTYDNAGGDLTTVACSDGSNGFIPQYSTFGQLPGFPYIGAVAAVEGWNSVNCGKCYSLTYNGVTITILAVDHADDGFNISLEALNELTNGQGEFLGSVQATAQEVPCDA